MENKTAEEVLEKQKNYCVGVQYSSAIKAMNEYAQQEIAAYKSRLRTEIPKILKGIDEDEIDYPYGWWETSTGVEFGKKKLEELLRLIDTL